MKPLFYLTFLHVLIGANPSSAQDIFDHLAKKAEKYIRKAEQREARKNAALTTLPAPQVGQRYSTEQLGFYGDACSPSDQFPKAVWCSTTDIASWSRVSALVTEDGRLAYINFEARINGADKRFLHNLAERLPPGHDEIELTPGPHQTSFVMVWGNAKAERLDQRSLDLLAKGQSPNVGFLIDHLNSFTTSAKSRYPVYRLDGSGSAWVANLTSNGQLSVRLLNYDTDLARGAMHSTKPDAASSSRAPTPEVSPSARVERFEPTTRDLNWPWEREQGYSNAQSKSAAPKADHVTVVEQQTQSAPVAKPKPTPSVQFVQNNVPRPTVTAQATLPTASYPKENNSGVKVEQLLLIVVFVLIALYFLPTMIAFRRRHPNRWIILAINFFAGVTLFGWVLSLIWAMRALHISETGSRGGESGLNLLVNDESRVAVTSMPTLVLPPPVPTVATNLASQLADLHRMLEQGLLSADEFTAAKQRLIGLPVT